jgi:hypothetical protein
MKTPVDDGPEASARRGLPRDWPAAIAPRHGPASRPQAPHRVSYLGSATAVMSDL